MLPTALWMSSRRISAMHSSPRMITDGQARPPSSSSRSSRSNKHHSSLVRHHLPSIYFPAASALSPSGLLKSRHHSSKMMARNNTTRNGASSTTTTTELNVMIWCEHSCPSDVLPKILAFLGPKRWIPLSQTNVFWNKQVFGNDATWKCLSEELYKWKEGQDDIPNTSWRDYYCRNPCVPVDYSTIPAAMAIARNNNNSPMEQQCSIKIWLRPAKYYLREALVVQTCSSDVKIELQTQELPTNVYRPAQGMISTTTSPTTSTTSALSPQKRVLQRARRVRNSLLCRSTNAAMNQQHQEDADDADLEHEDEATTPTRACIILKSRRVNEPLLRVRQGSVSLTNIQLLHTSSGLDIWNGNAAIHVGPSEQAAPLMDRPRPSCFLKMVDVSSTSGRGIVGIDGGHLNITSSVVHHCAATGIYVGGLGTTATITKSDVVCNGNGNRTRRGVPRGHSGIYLEQGHAVVRDSNISNNSLTGISATSMENAILILQQSSLVDNGTNQLEMPPLGSWARRQSRVENEGNFVGATNANRKSKRNSK
mmetsp:Transcript_25181/g.36849  ORF Transcript_25181/g.36849 Transcript_25181/m.36849 type:complete len:537 (-) Transcript_25181:257-1867(-)